MAASSSIEIVDLEDDDLFSKGTSKQNAIPVEQHDENRDTRRAIMASLGQNIINLDDYDDDLRLLDFVPQNSPFGSKRRSQKGESSKSNSQNDDGCCFVCDICVEPMSASECFRIKGCSHSYCTDCMMKYVASKLQENITSIPCPSPNCKALLEPEHCRDLLPEDVFERWGSALCEALILGAQKFYCPFKDCSALLIDDGDGAGGGQVIRESECPYCRRLFCAQCKVPWHSEISCAEFQKLNKNEREREDIMLMKLAKNNNWKRCPNCKFFVEKKEGCMYMMCR